MQEILEIWTIRMQKLKFSLENSQIMVINKIYQGNVNIRSTSKGQFLEVVTSCVYWGCIMTNNGEIGEEIENRVGKLSINLLCSRLVPKKSRLTDSCQTSPHKMSHRGSTSIWSWASYIQNYSLWPYLSSESI